MTPSLLRVQNDIESASPPDQSSNPLYENVTITTCTTKTKCSPQENRSRNKEEEYTL